MASFVIASIAYSKLNVTKRKKVWTENGRKGAFYWSPEHGVWYAVM